MSACVIMTEKSECIFFTYNGFRLHAHSFGSGSPVVLLHGFPEYWAIWRGQINGLVNDYRVIALDLPGFNLSTAPSRPNRMRSEDISEALLALITHLGIGQFSLIGHDIGGLLALACAARDPARIARLALVSSPHPADFISLRAGRPPDTPKDYADRILAHDDTGLFKPERLSFWIQNSNEKSALQAAMTSSDCDAIGALYRDNLAFDDLARWASLPAPACSVRAIYGDSDPFLPVTMLEGPYLRSLPNVTTRKLAGGGHFLHSSHPEWLGREIREWLAL
ncbi:alpha/beta fold hydrolase [Aestuariivirga sp.]|uniref:alpha/beta fold hydrolase n=1 Tax=Aestuariivirga sp. TaxID=2650926 RepID=UPI0039E6D376